MTLTMTQVTPPNIIEIGGVHCAPGKPLPLNFQKIMESAPEVDKDDDCGGDDGGGGGELVMMVMMVNW